MDTAKIFNNGRSQAVRLPKKYRMDNDEVYIKKYGSVIMLIPKGSEWKVMEDSIGYFSDDFMADRKQPPVQKRDEF